MSICGMKLSRLCCFVFEPERTVHPRERTAPKNWNIFTNIWKFILALNVDAVYVLHRGEHERMQYTRSNSIKRNKGKTSYYLRPINTSYQTISNVHKWNGIHMIIFFKYAPCHKPFDMRLVCQCLLMSCRHKTEVTSTPRPHPKNKENKILKGKQIVTKKWAR